MTQVILDSLIMTGEISLLAVGLTMVYGSLGFPNFAHVEFATVGAYVALLLNGLGLPLQLAIPAAMVVAGLLGVVSDKVVFAKLRSASPIMLMIASFALGIVIRESVRAIWGTSPHFYELGLMRPLAFWGMRVTPLQLGIIATAVVCMVGFHLLLNHTRLGISMRATSDNPSLAKASGIDTDRVLRIVWFIGAGFAALGGILIGLETQIHPNTGFAIIVPVFCAALLGGIGNPRGAMAGAAIVAFAMNVALAVNFAPLGHLLDLTTKEFWKIPTGYKEAAPFVLLILVLLWRPSGLFGGTSK
ncbi:branched-chain amino acid ABC transporter permease [Desulfohalovibrio reitneri]|uniref:branched-chain amino acid ABC transporter permease n=1 Tax=Desulfohalovibrio reitneri TaxID=1307759 RepID=UPI0004A6BFC2|nr:branched-chain amino acid ABC transporter permease [Desulfohalovibrio reitneri]